VLRTVRRELGRLERALRALFVEDCDVPIFLKRRGRNWFNRNLSAPELGTALCLLDVKRFKPNNLAASSTKPSEPPLEMQSTSSDECMLHGDRG
jgi:hypothetical protein